MRSFVRLALPSLLLLAPLVACSAPADSNAESGAAAVTDCANVRSTPTRSEQKNTAGDVTSTTLTVEAAGCIASDDPAKLVDKLVALVEDDQKLSSVSNATGKIFSKYSPHSPTGEIGGPTGLVRTVDVTFNAKKNPSTTIKVSLKKSSTGEVSFGLTNTKGVGVLVWTAIEPGGLDVRLTVKPSAGGVTISGTTKVVVQPGYEDSVKGMDELPSLVIHWLQDQVKA